MAEHISIKILNSVIDWLQLQLKKRESWDSLMIFTISLFALIATPIIRYVSWIGLAYSSWRLWQKYKGTKKL